MAAALFAGAALALGVSRSAPFPNERAVCDALGDLLAALEANDDDEAKAAEDRLREASLRTQNIHLAWFGQSYTEARGATSRPDALPRLRAECATIGLPVDP